jgi:hypothetical protein
VGARRLFMHHFRLTTTQPRAKAADFFSQRTRTMLSFHKPPIISNQSQHTQDTFEHLLNSSKQTLNNIYKTMRAANASPDKLEAINALSQQILQCKTSGEIHRIMENAETRKLLTAWDDTEELSPSPSPAR